CLGNQTQGLLGCVSGQRHEDQRREEQGRRPQVSQSRLQRRTPSRLRRDASAAAPSSQASMLASRRTYGRYTPFPPFFGGWAQPRSAPNGSLPPRLRLTAVVTIEPQLPRHLKRSPQV